METCVTYEGKQVLYYVTTTPSQVAVAASTKKDVLALSFTNVPFLIKAPENACFKEAHMKCHKHLHFYQSIYLVWSLGFVT